MRSLYSRPATDLLEVRDDEEGNWDFDGMVTAEEVTMSGVRGKLWEVQRIREDGGEAVPTLIVVVIKLAFKSIEAKRKNETLSDQNTDMKAKRVETCIAGGRMREHPVDAELGISSLRTQLYVAQMALKKLTGASSRTENGL